jgi:hypothetical protein
LDAEEAYEGYVLQPVYGREIVACLIVGSRKENSNSPRDRSNGFLEQSSSRQVIAYDHYASAMAVTLGKLRGGERDINAVFPLIARDDTTRGTCRIRRECNGGPTRSRIS